MQRQTTTMKPQEIEKKWLIVDAKGKNLGRLASEVAQILMGKKKACYTPNVDCGDYVIIINAKEVNLTGNKEFTKNYYNVSEYLGGLRTRSAKTMKEKYPCEMVERAVWGMLPKGPLGRQMYKKLFVYADANHKHQAQNPQVYEIK
ncbi:MAG: 50S ribosomal protein L13 [Bacilli bacterium]|nr:50S ribosomal protein L13 [Bacilli bacterium]MDD3422489.1 50S ribosomal protein L13 [Bacilli bacterium]MDD4065941.1 50S ribosomal protein L13 [Bacilli bacterium]